MHPFIRKHQARLDAERLRKTNTIQAEFAPLYENNQLIRSYARDALNQPPSVTILEFASKLPRDEREKAVTWSEFVTGIPHANHRRKEPAIARSIMGWIMPDAFLQVYGNEQITSRVLMTADGILYNSFAPSQADPTSTFAVHRQNGVSYSNAFPVYATSHDEMYHFFQGDQREESRKHLGNALLQL